MISLWSRHEPEFCGLGLLWCPLCTVARPVGFDLVVIGRPFLTCERDRWTRPKLVRAFKHEWLQRRPRRCGNHSGRHIDAGLRSWTVSVDSGGAIGSAGVEDSLCHKFAKP